MNRTPLRLLLLLLVASFVFTSCSKLRKEERSSTTGWKYNDQEWGGFEVQDYEGQATGPNLVLIPGGTFSMGSTAEDVVFEWDNTPRRVTVSSFYMDETEVSNVDYREYLYDLSRWYKDARPDVYYNALPDTLVWREELAFNEPMVENYFRFPSYQFYPVVGVSWEQSHDYCVWRTNKVNNMILIERGILNPNPDEGGSDVFDTQAYLHGMYDANVRKNLPDLATGGERPVRFEDGIVLPSYRLPTEAEWEYAALSLHGKMRTNKDELIEERRFFPWDGYTARAQRRDRDQGKMLANYKRARGDYMGVSTHLNDNASRPAEVDAYFPNDFGLFNMAGNVSEWVADVYRPTTQETMRDVENHDLDPFRGNVFKEMIRDENGRPLKDSLGRVTYRTVIDSTIGDRRNYKKADVRNFLDGDDESIVYDYGKHSLISDSVRVIKGGSWADRLYWLSPGARRFLRQDQASNKVGFRCAMVRTGGPTGNDDSGGNAFLGKKRKRNSYKY